MPWYGYVSYWSATVIIIPFCVWVVVQIFGIKTRLAELESQHEERERGCEERLHWLRDMDKKLDRVCEDTAEIKGLLKGMKRSKT